ncbi:hypothetical protein N7519_003920 [Penicillium mononematosum]|uniref:uncharacterized protein n=1 Tax=Penicillium mononematosum TaxID=268346 RepID=UPI002546D70B|nr:uncharacterized protein N7519_003920 [Penicillium mononematosum]KAJ6189012.1 hypothetical protein N7519_003920 [Penicillium mononematosum]
MEAKRELLVRNNRPYLPSSLEHNIGESAKKVESALVYIIGNLLSSQCMCCERGIGPFPYYVRVFDSEKSFRENHKIAVHARHSRDTVHAMNAADVIKDTQRLAEEYGISNEHAKSVAAKVEDGNLDLYQLVDRLKKVTVAVEKLVKEEEEASARLNHVSHGGEDGFEPLLLRSVGAASSF